MTVYRDSKDVKIAEELLSRRPCDYCKGSLSLKNLAKEFKKLTGKSLSTFKRYKRLILTGKRTCRGKLRCYFCGTTYDLVLHHINQNRQDNSDKNLLVLCRACHSRIHHIYNLLGL